MKKLLFVFVVLSLVLAACGTPAAEAPAGEQAATVAPAATPAGSGKAPATVAEITFSMWGAPKN